MLALLFELRHPDTCYSCDWSPDGRTIVSGGNPGEAPLRLWDVDTREARAELTVHPDDNMSCCRFSHDGRAILSVTADDECAMRLWNAATGACLATVGNLMEDEMQCDLDSCAWSPDDSAFACGHGNTLKVLDVTYD